MPIKVYSTGATEEVTGSHHFINVDGDIIEVDCGMFQGNKEKSDLKNRQVTKDIDKIKSIILTHAHFDHSGALPYTVKNGYRGPIYMTSATRDLTNIVIMDSAKIQENDSKLPRKSKDTKSYIPLYSSGDCLKTLQQIVTVPYGKSFPLTKRASFKMYNAGHILGSSMVEVSIKSRFNPFKKDTKILYTGDLGRQNNPLIERPETHIDAPDYIYLESTYGNKLHENTSVAISELEDTINKTIKRGGKVIIPSFAIERTQEIIYYLHNLLKDKRIPNVPIYVDSPMATNATSVFQVHLECYNQKVKKLFLDKNKNPFHFNKLSFVSSAFMSKKLDKSTEPMIIITADGMCEGGRVLQHLESTISDSKNTVVIVGYMAEDTLGRHISEGERIVNIEGTSYEVKADVLKINAFSAHSDYNETLNWLSKIDTSKLKGIFLVHGDKPAQEYLKGILTRTGYKNVVISKNNEVYKLLGRKTN